MWANDERRNCVLPAPSIGLDAFKDFSAFVWIPLPWLWLLLYKFSSFRCHSPSLLTQIVDKDEHWQNELNEERHRIEKIEKGSRINNKKFNRQWNSIVHETQIWCAAHIISPCNAITGSAVPREKSVRTPIKRIQNNNKWQFPSSRSLANLYPPPNAPDSCSCSFVKLLFVSPISICTSASKTIPTFNLCTATRWNNRKNAEMKRAATTIKHHANRRRIIKTSHGKRHSSEWPQKTNHLTCFSLRWRVKA